MIGLTANNASVRESCISLRNKQKTVLVVAPFSVYPYAAMRSRLFRVDCLEDKRLKILFGQSATHHIYNPAITSDSNR